MGRIETNFKQTEVGLIPVDWNFVELRNIAEVKTGNTPPTKDKDNYGDSFFFVSPADLGKQKYITNTEKKLTTKGFSLSRQFPVNSILFTCIGSTIGKSGIAKQFLTSNQQINAILPNDGYITDFIFYILDLLSDKIRSFASEQAVPLINKTDFEATLIPIPPTKTEQTAIANALSDADVYIESLEKLIDKKQKIKQGAMQRLLKPKENWEVKKLGEVADIVRGASPRPIEDPKWFNNNSSIGWVRISDVTSSIKTLQFTTQKLSDLGIKSSRYVERGNLIMSICATIGRPILTLIDVCIHDGFVVFRNPAINKEYLYYFLFFIEKDWSKNGQTGSQMNLNTNLIKTTKIYLPPTKTEQQQIAQTLSDIDNEITALNQKLTKAKAIKQGMMQQLLTGKIRLI